MKINFILGSALLLSQSLCAQNEEAKDTLTTQMMMQNLPEVFVKATRPIVKAERGQLVYNMPLLIEKMPADNAYDALTRIPGVNELNGNINYAGKELTLIINGKPTTLNYAQLAERLRVTISLTCPSIANISLPFLPEIYPPSLAEAITSISYLTHSISRKPFKDSMTSNQSFS